MGLANEIKAKALEIGFDKIGIVPAAELSAETARLADWLRGGFHADMAWLERVPRKRTDPALIFPEARTVVAVALNYFTPHDHRDSPQRGKISRYAWGDDYHDHGLVAAKENGEPIHPQTFSQTFERLIVNATCGGSGFRTSGIRTHAGAQGRGSGQGDLRAARP